MKEVGTGVFLSPSLMVSRKAELMKVSFSSFEFYAQRPWLPKVGSPQKGLPLTCSSTPGGLILTHTPGNMSGLFFF